MKSSHEIEEIRKKFQALLTENNEAEGISHDSYILMAGYLSEIERIQNISELSRKDLASKINKSGSYLTQVFRGNKPLNFDTIARIQRALKIRFNVSAAPIDEVSMTLSAIPYPEHKPAKVIPFDFKSVKLSSKPEELGLIMNS